MLANSHQVEEDPDMALATALLFGSPFKRSTTKSTRRPQTAPHTHTQTTHSSSSPPAQRSRMPTPPTSWLTKRGRTGELGDAPPPLPMNPRANKSTASLAGSLGDGLVSRHSEPLPAMPLPVPCAVREQAEHERGRQMSWASSASASTSAASTATGTSSEPNSPRPGHARPRLKSLKGLFKHWSK